MTDRRTALVRLQIEHDEKDIAAAVDSLRLTVVRTVDWREWVKRWPAQAVVGAFVVGFVLGRR
jgi:hypothetical protein